jgi:alkanesulfonate monooxygenase SsuD/methylene tetrahydromethanopterin reductase-like flavin-dependent oxidoreductase (luciferase family)
MTVLDREGAGPLHVGISLPDPTFEVAKDVILRAEAAGLDTLSVGDGLEGPESFTMLSAAAALTERIELKSSVTGWVRSPAITAHAATTLSAFSKGRFSLGMGPLPRYRVVDWHGMPYDPVMARFKEWIQCLAACLDATPDHPTDFTGQWYSSHGWVGQSFERRRPPILLAATQRHMTELAGELAEGVSFNMGLPLTWLETTARDYLRTGLARAGRTTDGYTVAVGRVSGIHADREQAYQMARIGIASYLSVPYFNKIMIEQGFETEIEAGQKAIRDKDWTAQVAAVSDDIVDSIAIAGTPDEALTKIRKYEGVVDSISLGPGPTYAGTQEQRVAHAHELIDILKEAKK